jgi:hypothetical protein
VRKKVRKNSQEEMVRRNGQEKWSGKWSGNNGQETMVRKNGQERKVGK